MTTNEVKPQLPPGVLLYQMAIGHYVSRAMYLAAHLSLPDLLKDGPRHFSDLAKATDTNGAALNRVMRLLSSVGIFDELEGGKFRNTALGELMRADVLGSSRASVMLFSGPAIQDSWKELEYCVRTGKPAFKRTDPDGDPFTALAKNPEAAAVFDKAMATFAPQTAAAVAASYDFSRFKTLMDVGGGNGALLIGIMKTTPALHGIVFDLPPVADRARESIRQSGLAERCDARGGSFFDSVPKGADAILLKHVIHDWNDEDSIKILSNCRAALSPGGKLLIVEGVYPPRIDGSLEARGAAMNDVNMLVSTGGRQRSEAEFRSLASAAGLKFLRIVPTPARVAVIESEMA